jgi:zinc transporter 2
MKILLTVAGVCCFFMVIEIIGGYIANSLAILSDAAHLFTDISGFLISIFSIWITSMKPNKKMTYGYYRAEIIGAMASTILIWGLTAWLIVAAVARIHNPEPIDAKLMIIISCLGLCFNLIMMKILDDG